MGANYGVPEGGAYSRMRQSFEYVLHVGGRTQVVSRGQHMVPVAAPEAQASSCFNAASAASSASAAALSGGEGGATTPIVSIIFGMPKNLRARRS